MRSRQWSLEKGEVWRYREPGAYLALIRKARAALAEGRLVRIRWTDEPLDAEGFRREFVRALNRRIDLKVTNRPRGRRHGDDYQRGLIQDCMAARAAARRSGPVRVYQFNTELVRRRCGHLLSARDD